MRFKNGRKKKKIRKTLGFYYRDDEKKKKKNRNRNRLMRPGRNITSDYKRRTIIEGELKGGTSYTENEDTILLLIRNKCIFV